MDLQPYSHDCSSKISRAFFASRKQSIIIVLLEPTLKEKLPFVLINTLLLRIPLLALIDRQTELRTEEQIHFLRVGWRNFFSSCAVVSVFWFLVGNRFWCYLNAYLEYNTVVALCQVFGSGGRQFLVLHMYLVYNILVRLCQFFGCGRKQCCGRKQFSK